MLLLAIWQSERAIECIWMRSRQDGERGEPLGVFVADAPRDAAAPIVADEMKARQPKSQRNPHRVINQLVEDVVIGVRGSRPRTRRIAPLTGSNRAIAGACERRDLVVPVMERLGKAMQQQHGRALLGA